jgi:para-nitrobenzyl esterase
MTRQVRSWGEDVLAQTTQGRVRGFVDGDIFTYLGIPYGASTAGQGRFAAPLPAPSWDGTRPCLVAGCVSPQPARAGATEATRAYQEERFLLQWRDGVQSEDCLNLNVWTPGLDREARRPVMVWLHGGHFAFGSSLELPATNGAALCRRGDVVVVSVNHRLNIFGYLPWLEGDDGTTAENPGMLDLVLALEWVRDNIEGFGGDPDCVTIFGQSGGGAKVTTLLAMPKARGLFHRAIVQSNCALRQAGPDQAERVLHAVHTELGEPNDPVNRLGALAPEALLQLESRVMARVMLPDNPARRNARIRWEPVVGGETLPRHAWDPDAPGLASEVPLLVGTTLDEFFGGIGVETSNLTDAELETELRQHFGTNGGAIHDLFRRKYPDWSPFRRRARAYSATIRQCAVVQARRKAAQRASPSYLYWFRWVTPALDGRPGAFHTAELPFVFDNVSSCVEWTGGGEEASALAAKVSASWIAFARSGSPGHEGLPQWSPVTEEGSETMCFDSECRFDGCFDEDERALTGSA